MENNSLTEGEKRILAAALQGLAFRLGNPELFPKIIDISRKLGIQDEVTALLNDWINYSKKNGD